jgi:uncharacterized membrane protein
MSYLAVKWVHILSSTVLFGTGIGSAYYMLLTSLTREPRAKALVVRRVVWADWLFTTPTVFLQPLSGLYLLHLAGLSAGVSWVRESLWLYALAIACWIPVVRLQIVMQRLAQQAADAGAALPPAYFRCLRWWAGLGAIAFVAFVAIFWLMVFKPS